MLTPLLLALAVQDIAIPPAPRGFGTSAAEVVVDAASVLSPVAEDRINRIAFEVHGRTGGEMAFVTMPDLGGRDVAEVALRIGREWGVGSDAGIGDRTRNAGIVVLVVPRETNSEGRGRIRIETGRGVEGFITDAIAGDIQREAIPYFQRGDYDGAMVLIAERIAERFAREFGVSFDTAVVPPARPLEPAARRGTGISPGSIIFFLIILFFLIGGAGGRGRRGRGGNGCLWLLLSAAMQQQGGRGRHRSGWGGGGFGGGSFGGG
ncbi:MAG TPA: TPM domain-containing protein, partial [Gemmatimonadaceae bacterium]|nr:TPM domain-containing protein [Gemmatimonadaceae bacterium]